MFQSDAFKNRISELGAYLEPYLARLGITPDAGGKIKCLHPQHNDRTPSMVLMKPDRQALYCYGCGAHMDICDVASVLEGKADHGQAFIADNVNYLSETFGLPKIEVTMTETQEQELLLQKVYRRRGAFSETRSVTGTPSCVGGTTNAY